MTQQQSQQQSQQLLNLQKLNTTLYANNSTTKLLQNVNLQLNENEIMALVGLSGSGKTMLWKSMVGVLNPKTTKQLNNYFNTEATINGSITNNSQIQSLNKLLGQKNGIGIIFQEPHASLDPLMTIGKQISEIITLHRNKKMTKQEVTNKVHDALTQVELNTNYHNRYPHQLSGGEAQRVAIALAIANKPKLIIADEPTSNLDETNQILIINMLQKLCQQNSTSLILITHNMVMAASVAQKIAILQNGTIIETINNKPNSNLNNLIANAKQEHTKNLLIANQFQTKHKTIPNNQIDNKDHNKDHNKKTRFFTLTNNNSQTNNKPLTPKGENITQTMWDKGATDKQINLNKCTNAIEIKNLTKIYNNRKGHATALKNINLNIPAEKITALIGQSGSGKSTLANILAGLETHSEGTITVWGEKTNTTQRYKHVRIVTQYPNTMLNPKMTIKNILRNSATNNYNPAIHPYHVEYLMNEFILPTDALNKYPHQLSGGQKQRIAIITALLGGATILIADEITSALDANATATILNMLLDINERLGTTILLTTHNTAIIKGFADHTATLDSHG